MPVTDLTTPRGRYVTRVVQPGETLYMIAWEAGLDYRQLAEWNGLVNPYTLKAGRRLKLVGPLVMRQDERTESNFVETADPNLASSSSYSMDISDDISQATWSWPANGKIIKQFNLEVRSNGIDIAGAIGDDVKASLAGLVVYAGSGLRGYGELIIIQHNEAYLSAYAHNHRVFVKEGETVRRGEVIAELGSSGTKSPRLHFEIRKNGKPVNPLNLLPKG